MVFYKVKNISTVAPYLGTFLSKKEAEEFLTDYLAKRPKDHDRYAIFEEFQNLAVRDEIRIAKEKK